jgi:hypothetical protein
MQAAIYERGTPMSSRVWFRRRAVRLLPERP